MTTSTQPFPREELLNRFFGIGALALTILASSGLVRAQEGETRAYLKGVDLSLPSQEAFRGWPPSTLVDRGWWLPWARHRSEHRAVPSRRGAG